MWGGTTIRTDTPTGTGGMVSVPARLQPAGWTKASSGKSAPVGAQDFHNQPWAVGSAMDEVDHTVDLAILWRRNAMYLHGLFYACMLHPERLSTFADKTDTVWLLDFFGRRFVSLRPWRTARETLQGALSQPFDDTIDDKGLGVRQYSSLHRCEKDLVDPCLARLRFFRNEHPIELLLSTPDERQRFYECVKTLRLTPVWCPALCPAGVPAVSTVGIEGSFPAAPLCSSPRDVHPMSGSTTMKVSRDPTSPLRLWVGSFDLNNALLPERADLSPWLQRGVADVYVIGLVGIPPEFQGSTRLGDQLAFHLGPHYIPVLSTELEEGLRSVAVVVLCTKTHALRVSDTGAWTGDYTRTRTTRLVSVKKVHRGMMSSKTNQAAADAVAVAFRVNETPLCFVCTKLALLPHEIGDEAVQVRNQILADLLELVEVGMSRIDVTSRFHHVVVLGGLGHEILREVQKGNALVGFTEGDLILPQGGSLDQRILWRSYPGLTMSCTNYAAHVPWGTPEEGRHAVGALLELTTELLFVEAFASPTAHHHIIIDACVLECAAEDRTPPDIPLSGSSSSSSSLSRLPSFGRKKTSRTPTKQEGYTVGGVVIQKPRLLAWADFAQGLVRGVMGSDEVTGLPVASFPAIVPTTHSLCFLERQYIVFLVEDTADPDGDEALCHGAGVLRLADVLGGVWSADSETMALAGEGVGLLRSTRSVSFCVPLYKGGRSAGARIIGNLRVEVDNTPLVEAAKEKAERDEVVRQRVVAEEANGRRAVEREEAVEWPGIVTEALRQREAAWVRQQRREGEEGARRDAERKEEAGRRNIETTAERERRVVEGACRTEVGEMVGRREVELAERLGFVEVVRWGEGSFNRSTRLEAYRVQREGVWGGAQRAMDSVWSEEHAAWGCLVKEESAGLAWVRRLDGERGAVREEESRGRRALEGDERGAYRVLFDEMQAGFAAARAATAGRMAQEAAERRRCEADEGEERRVAETHELTAWRALLAQHVSEREGALNRQHERQAVERREREKVLSEEVGGRDVVVREEGVRHAALLEEMRVGRVALEAEQLLREQVGYLTLREDAESELLLQEEHTEWVGLVRRFKAQRRWCELLGQERATRAALVVREGVERRAIMESVGPSLKHHTSRMVRRLALVDGEGDARAAVEEEWEAGVRALEASREDHELLALAAEARRHLQREQHLVTMEEMVLREDILKQQETRWAALEGERDHASLLALHHQAAREARDGVAAEERCRRDHIGDNEMACRLLLEAHSKLSALTASHASLARLVSACARRTAEVYMTEETERAAMAFHAAHSRETHRRRETEEALLAEHRGLLRTVCEVEWLSTRRDVERQEREMRGAVAMLARPSHVRAAQRATLRGVDETQSEEHTTRRHIEIEWEEGWEALRSELQGWLEAEAPQWREGDDSPLVHPVRHHGVLQVRRQGWTRVFAVLRPKELQCYQLLGCVDLSGGCSVHTRGELGLHVTALGDTVTETTLLAPTLPDRDQWVRALTGGDDESAPPPIALESLGRSHIVGEEEGAREILRSFYTDFMSILSRRLSPVPPASALPVLVPPPPSPPPCPSSPPTPPPPPHPPPPPPQPSYFPELYELLTLCRSLAHSQRLVSPPRRCHRAVQCSDGVQAQDVDELVQLCDSLHDENDVLTRRNDALERQNDALERRNDALERQIDALQRRNDALERGNAALEQQVAEVEGVEEFLPASPREKHLEQHVHLLANAVHSSRLEAEAGSVVVGSVHYKTPPRLSPALPPPTVARRDPALDYPPYEPGEPLDLTPPGSPHPVLRPPPPPPSKKKSRKPDDTEVRLLHELVEALELELDEVSARAKEADWLESALRHVLHGTIHPGHPPTPTLQPLHSDLSKKHDVAALSELLSRVQLQIELARAEHARHEEEVMQKLPHVSTALCEALTRLELLLPRPPPPPPQSVIERSPVKSS